MSTMAEVAVGQNMMTDKCIDEFFAGNVKTANAYRLVLLNLSLGAATLTQAGTVFWSDLSAAETATGGNYTKGTGVALTTPVLTAMSAHGRTLDFDDASIAAATLTADAYALVRWVTSTADSPVLAMGKFSAAKTPAAVTLSIPIAGIVRLAAGVAA